MAKKVKKSTRGNRYTPQQKAEVLSYVDAINAERGRGGAAEASRKFKISQITIGQWIKKSGKPASHKNGATSSVDFNNILRRLTEVHEEIGKKEAELEALRSEYTALKRRL